MYFVFVVDSLWLGMLQILQQLKGRKDKVKQMTQENCMTKY